MLKSRNQYRIAALQCMLHGALQTNRQSRIPIKRQVSPMFVRQAYRLLAETIDDPGDQVPVPGDTDPQRIFKHQQQEQHRRFRTIDRTVKTRCQQISHPADVIDMHMGVNQCFDKPGRKIDLQSIAARATRRGLRALKQSTIDQDADGRVDSQLMARPGHAVARTMVNDLDIHSSAFPLCNDLGNETPCTCDHFKSSDESYVYFGITRQTRVARQGYIVHVT